MTNRNFRSFQFWSSWSYWISWSWSFFWSNNYDQIWPNNPWNPTFFAEVSMERPGPFSFSVSWSLKSKNLSNHNHTDNEAIFFLKGHIICHNISIIMNLSIYFLSISKYKTNPILSLLNSPTHSSQDPQRSIPSFHVALVDSTYTDTIVLSDAMRCFQAMMTWKLQIFSWKYCLV